MINSKKPMFPITYGDIQVDSDLRISDKVVEVLENKRFQRHMTSVAGAIVYLAIATSAKAVPPEVGEAANEMLNQVTQNGATGGVPAMPPIGQIQGQVPLPQANPQVFIPAMPIEQQHLIAAQQAGKIGAGAINSPIVQPTNPPSFYIPDKPKLVVPRAVNTVAFTTALGVICLNAAWGEPVAILMCSSGLVGLAYHVGKEVVLFMAKSIK